MIENNKKKNMNKTIGVVIGALSGLWGVIAAISFTITMIAMDVGIGGFLFLLLHIILLLMLVAFAYFTIRTKPLNNYWPFLLIGSIVFLALSLIPGSTIGSIMFLPALGILVSSLLLKS